MKQFLTSKNEKHTQATQAKSQSKMGMASKVALGTLALVGSSAAMAANSASTDTTFESGVTMIQDFVQGTYGVLISLLILAIGVVQGLKQGSLWAAVPAGGAALVFSLGPTVINQIFTGALPTLI